MAWVALPAAALSAPEAGLEKHDVKRVIAAARPRMAACYREARSRGLVDTGKVTVEFEVRVTGRVERAEIIGSSFQDDAFHGCLLTTVRHLRFDPWQGHKLTVRYPLVFKPE